MTDPRFAIAGNEDVIEFIRRANPFAHSDAGSLQRGLAFRLAPSSRAEALADGGTAADHIGQPWVSFDPWNPNLPTAERQARLERWSARAFADNLERITMADGVFGKRNRSR